MTYWYLCHNYVICAYFLNFADLFRNMHIFFSQVFGLLTLAKRITANEFTKLAKEKFGNKFQYDLADYSKTKSKMSPRAKVMIQIS